jgi:tetrahydromethanopterin S-methyltransferase subunit B
MRIDPNFAIAVQEAEKHWLENANEILASILEEIRLRVTSENTSMKELVMALDTISNKWNLAMGKPTSFGVSANVKVDKTKMKDEELNERLKELEDHLNMGDNSALPHHKLLQEDADGIYPLDTQDSLGEDSTKEGE